MQRPLFWEIGDTASPGLCWNWDSSYPCFMNCRPHLCQVWEMLCLFRSPWWGTGSSRERTNEGLCWPARGTSDWAAGLRSLFSCDPWPGPGDCEWPEGTCSLLLPGCRLPVQLAAGSWGRWAPFWTQQALQRENRNEFGTRMNVGGNHFHLVP